MSLSYITAGESHGKGICAILEEIPSGLSISQENIDKELLRRAIGHGRGPRAEIEDDKVEILSGVRWGKTIGSPITLWIKNRDWFNWQDQMSTLPEYENRSLFFTRPRPGHADLSGALKYNTKDIRNVLERASARETVARVAVGAIAKELLRVFGIEIYSYVLEIANIRAKFSSLSSAELGRLADQSSLRCPDAEAEKKMIERIDRTKKRGDSLGGIFEVVGVSIPPGLGSYAQWHKRMDGRLSLAFMSIQGIKGVEIGLGFECAKRNGSQVHDEISYKDNDKDKGFFHLTNRAGGIEGGISNGENIVVRAAMKPIATLYKPLRSVDLITKTETLAQVERSDICRVSSCSVIGEAAMAFELAAAFLEKFGGDSISETQRNFEGYKKYLKEF